MDICIVKNERVFEVHAQLKNGMPGRLLDSFLTEQAAQAFAENRRVIAASATSIPAKDRPI